MAETRLRTSCSVRPTFARPASARGGSQCLSEVCSHLSSTSSCLRPCRMTTSVCFLGIFVPGMVMYYAVESLWGAVQKRVMMYFLFFKLRRKYYAAQQEVVRPKMLQIQNPFESPAHMWGSGTSCTLPARLRRNALERIGNSAVALMVATTHRNRDEIGTTGL